VFLPSLTFVASANAVLYTGAEPVFVDSELQSWNLCPDRLAEALADAARRGTLPAAVMAVDLFGQCADYSRILPLCRQYGVPLIEDAAEALGAFFRGQPAGRFGNFTVLSFNGNKIITTSGGGALLGDDPAAIDRARYLATQARADKPEYHHDEVGWNYRLSNLLAALGRSQLRDLERRVLVRREINARYRSALSGLPGLSFMPEAFGCESTFWLTCIQIDPRVAGFNAPHLHRLLSAENIETRPVWKPMHLQPIYARCKTVGGDVATALFRHGLCLPSGSSLSRSDQERICALIASAFESQKVAHR
jgi:dTDP-4-amino-4,6-dideoxygalactose transaminase